MYIILADIHAKPQHAGEYIQRCWYMLRTPGRNQGAFGSMCSRSRTIPIGSGCMKCIEMNRRLRRTEKTRVLLQPWAKWPIGKQSRQCKRYAPTSLRKITHGKSWSFEGSAFPCKPLEEFDHDDNQHPTADRSGAD